LRARSKAARQASSSGSAGVRCGLARGGALAEVLGAETSGCGCAETASRDVMGVAEGSVPAVGAALFERQLTSKHSPNAPNQ
jgi:hypothetical protein